MKSAREVCTVMCLFWCVEWREEKQVSQSVAGDRWLAEGKQIERMGNELCFEVIQLHNDTLAS